MPRAEVVREALKRRIAVPDPAFDAVYPCWAQEVSSRFWTPVHVAVDAADALRNAGARRVLDVGSGVGKFSLIAALVTDLDVTGVEHRPHLVASARRAAERYRASVQFVCASIEQIDPGDFDGFYLYNPFEENLVGASERLDDSVMLSSERFRSDVALVERWLEDAPIGSSLVTYNGFGGHIPASYRMASSRPCGRHFVRLWKKGATNRARRRSHIERGDNVFAIATARLKVTR
jgi:predicted RNA methylase